MATDGPAYQRVADELRTRIRSGGLASGTRLPSLPQLGADFGVSADVARQAVGVLRAEGLIETRQGSGAFVRCFAQIVRSSPGRLSRNTWGSGKAIQDDETGPRWRTADVVVSETPASADVAAALHVAEGEPVLSRARRFLEEDRPVQLATSFYPLAIVRGSAVCYTDTGAGGSYARLAELGHEPVRFTERVSARSPYPEEAFDLALPSTGGLVFSIVRFAYTAAERCVEVNRMILDAAAYTLEYQFPA